MKLKWRPLKRNQQPPDAVEPAVSAADAEFGPRLAQEVRDLLAQGRKIEAIKRVREVTNWGLKVSKDYVEAVQRGQSPALAVAPPPLKMADVRQVALDLLAQGRKIDAIKRVREATNWGLREAKDYVEALERGQPPPPLPSAPALPPNLDNLRLIVLDLLGQRRKIEAVKRVREATGWGLKESKDYVDALQAEV